jgi:hypothetical protein
MAVLDCGGVVIVVVDDVGGSDGGGCDIFEAVLTVILRLNSLKSNLWSPRQRLDR